MSQKIENRDEWSNTGTWTVGRAVVIDPDISHTWRDTTTAMLADENLSKDPRQLRNALARELREEFELFCCSYAGLVYDLLEVALAKVDWHEIADRMLLNHCQSKSDLRG
jgi:hypothetical protein